MKLGSFFAQKECVFALEVFPPKRENDVKNLYVSLKEMAFLQPDYISVTYSAGGKGGKEHTANIAAYLKNELDIEPLAHLTCTGLGQGDIKDMTGMLRYSGVENILALRGDKAPGQEAELDFTYASDLMRSILQNGDFYIVGACYPEGHPESDNMMADIEGLRQKIRAGSGHLISQLFFDNGKFFRFLNLVRKKGIVCPIEAGIMPVTKIEQIEKMITLSSASIPVEFSKIVSRYADDPASFYEAGIDYSIRQIRDLMESGVDGIHLYAMNNAKVARKVWDGIADLLQ